MHKGVWSGNVGATNFGAWSLGFIGLGDARLWSGLLSLVIV